MNDKELIELAAKAAGVCLHPKESLRHSYGNWGCDTTCGICKKEPHSSIFDPLKSDSDAFRLAMKLNIDICHNNPLDNGLYISASRWGIETVRNAVNAFEEIEDELHRAECARRAIVRTAAEIGKAMP